MDVGHTSRRWWGRATHMRADGPDVGLKAKVQHAVGLVQDQVCHFLRTASTQGMSVYVPLGAGWVTFPG